MLFEYQQTGVKFLVETKQCILADGMGLGKTIQSIHAMKQLLNEGKIDRVVILAPKSILHQWQEEMPDALLINAKTANEINNYKLFITNYEFFSGVAHLIPREKTLLICDEASNKLKNVNTGAYRIVKLFSVKLPYIWLLTGTAIENDLNNYFNLLQIIHGFPMKQSDFYNKFCITSTERFHGKEITRVVGYKNLQEFVEITAPFILRRDKDVVSLPEITIKNEFFEHTSQQQIMYKRIMQQTKKGVKLFELLTHLKMLDDSIEILSIDIPKVKEPINNKIERLKEVLEETESEKVIIFTQYAKMAQLISSKIEGSILVIGECNNKAELVQQFTNTKAKVMVSTDVFSYGINLDCADLLINFDIPWNPAVLSQRSARIHRLNSTRPKFVINFIGYGLERHVFDILAKKMKLFDDVVNGKVIKDIDLRKELLEKIGGAE